MTFKFELHSLNEKIQIKCPRIIAELLLSHTGLKLHKGMKFYITNITSHAIGFDIRFGIDLLDGRLFIVYRETMEERAKPENLQLFDLVTTNCKHGGEAAEMALEFVLNTLE